MRIAVASDSVRDITRAVCAHLEANGHELHRFGSLGDHEADYVDAAREAAEAIAGGVAELGVLFCNTGTGVSIIANKVPGARAALCVDEYSARIARLANNANIVVLSMRYTGEGVAKEIVDAFVGTQPSGETSRKSFHRKTDELDQFYRSRQGAHQTRVGGKSAAEEGTRT